MASLKKVKVPSTNVGASSPWPFGKRLNLARSCFGWLLDRLLHKSEKQKKNKKTCFGYLKK